MNDNKQTPLLLTADAAAERLGISKSWLKKHSGNGKLSPRVASIFMGRNRKYAESDLLAFIEANRSVESQK